MDKKYRHNSTFSTSIAAYRSLFRCCRAGVRSNGVAALRRVFVELFLGSAPFALVPLGLLTRLTAYPIMLGARERRAEAPSRAPRLCRSLDRRRFEGMLVLRHHHFARSTQPEIPQFSSSGVYLTAWAGLSIPRAYRGGTALFCCSIPGPLLTLLCQMSMAASVPSSQVADARHRRL